MSDRMEGAAREFGGRVQEAAGDVLGDSKTKAEGLYNQASGQTQQALGQLTDIIREQPLASAAIALGIGYLLGRLS
ncbi:MAG: CsbD family protein [Acetobacteraceae bacterium]|nr:CsbD family protein [Acetobacteraceae bacterium]